MSDHDAIVSGAKKGGEYGRMIAQILIGVFFVLTRPICLVSQVLFRRDFGERHLTGFTALGGAALIGVATGVSVLMVDRNNVPWGGLESSSLPSGRIVPMVIGGVWLLLFVAGVKEQAYRVRSRHRMGVRWHSWNSGVPRVSSMTGGVEMVLGIGLGIVMCFLGVPLLGLLMIFSAIHSAMNDAHAMSQFYNRILDTIDGQIEADNLTKAIEYRLEPTQIEGLLATLPTSMSKDFRSKIVRAIDEQRGKPPAASIIEPKSDQPAPSVAPDLGQEPDPSRR